MVKPWAEEIKTLDFPWRGWEWVDGENDKPGYFEIDIPDNVLWDVEMHIGEMAELGDEIWGTVRLYPQNAYINIQYFLWSGGFDYTRDGDGDGEIPSGFTGSSIIKMPCGEFLANPDDAIFKVLQWSILKKVEQEIEILKDKRQ